MRLTTVLIWFLLLPVAGGAFAQGGGVDTPKAVPASTAAAAAIADSHRLFLVALGGGDSALFASRFASDCWIMGPGQDVVCGDDAPGELFTHLHTDLHVRSGRFITADVFGNSGEFVTEVGFYQLFDIAGKIVSDGTLMVLWRKTAAGWKMFRTSFHKD